MRKKAPLTVERKNGKGGVASEQTSTPSLPRKREISSVPLFLLFPHEPLRWVRAGAPPLQSPLKRPRRGLMPPSWIIPGVWFVQITFQISRNAMQMRIWIDRRGSRNTLRVGRADSTRKRMRVDVGIDPYEALKVGNASNFIRQIFNGREQESTKEPKHKPAKRLCFGKDEQCNGRAFAPCAEARDMEFVRTPPEGRSVYGKRNDNP